VKPPNSALHRTWSRNVLRPKCATISRRGSKPVSLDPLAVGRDRIAWRMI
jgi:hypothetical protein